MLNVHVKHYLTTEGINFLQQFWFPKVQAILSEQPGYVALELLDKTYPDSLDCCYLVLTFESQELLDAWCAHPVHDALIVELNNYGSRSYWEFGVAYFDTPVLNWQKVA